MQLPLAFARPTLRETGRDVAREVFAVRGRNEESDSQAVIERALVIACDTLIPRGLDANWRDLTLAERHDLRALDRDFGPAARFGVNVISPKTLLESLP